jgi:hypothetical protein
MATRTQVGGGNAPAPAAAAVWVITSLPPRWRGPADHARHAAHDAGPSLGDGPSSDAPACHAAHAADAAHPGRALRGAAALRRVPSRAEGRDRETAAHPRVHRDAHERLPQLRLPGQGLGVFGAQPPHLGLGLGCW